MRRAATLILLCACGDKSRDGAATQYVNFYVPDAALLSSYLTAGEGELSITVEDRKLKSTFAIPGGESASATFTPNGGWRKLYLASGEQFYAGHAAGATERKSSIAIDIGGTTLSTSNCGEAQCNFSAAQDVALGGKALGLSYSDFGVWRGVVSYAGRMSDADTNEYDGIRATFAKSWATGDASKITTPSGAA